MFWFLIIVGIFVLHGIVLSLFVVMENRHPMATIAWILALIFVPFLGALLYFFFGRLRFQRRRRLRARALEPLFSARHHEHPPSPEALAHLQGAHEQQNHSALPEIPRYHRSPPPTPPPASQYHPIQLPSSQRDSTPVIALAERIVHSPITLGNRVQILPGGMHTYTAIEYAIESAQHHIHVMYYIFRHDRTGTQLRDALIRRAKAGVRVRFLYDAIGTYSTPASFFQPLRDAGAEVESFLPLQFKLSLQASTLNFRNHRKLIVVDGKIGFTGRLNVGDEYKGEQLNLGHWRDTHLQIKGPSVHYLQHVFCEDWCHVTDAILTEDAYYPFGESCPEERQNGLVESPHTPISTEAPDTLPECLRPLKTHQTMAQIIPSGPDHPWFPIRLLFFSAITTARTRVWMTTPYFVPDNAILTALITAALRGVDVRLLLPAQTDHPLVHYAGRSYYRRLLRAGVRLYEYEKGMLHAKTMVVDRHYGTIGSANLDLRSFHTNFEINAWVYGESFAQELEQHYLEDLQNAREIEYDTFEKRSWKERFFEASARVFSPLL